MTRKKKRRLMLIGSALAIMAVAVGIALFALRDNVVFFYGPAELLAKGTPPGTRLRIGGLVKPGSVERAADKPMTFVVTDNVKNVTVTYSGQVPDLFREGQGVVAEGVLTGPAIFSADSILAKHDETYMPREVADALKKQGRWQEGGNKQTSNASGQPEPSKVR